MVPIVLMCRMLCNNQSLPAQCTLAGCMRVCFYHLYACVSTYWFQGYFFYHSEAIAVEGYKSMWSMLLISNSILFIP